MKTINPFAHAPYRVITLCGSLKFEKSFQRLQIYLERIGHVCLSVTIGELNIPPTDCEKSIIDKVHFKKIALSDCIIVLDLEYQETDRYIGCSTENEIEYARLTNKEIYYVSELLLPKNVIK